jgi:hypothetical protein
MPSVIVGWKGSARESQVRYRLLGHLHRLAVLSDEYLRLKQPERPFILTVMNEKRGVGLQNRSNIETIDRPLWGRVVVSSGISPLPETLLSSTREAGLSVLDPEGEGTPLIVLPKAHLRGLDFKLFDPRGLYPGDDRMSFVFLECPDYPFLDGRLVELAGSEAGNGSHSKRVRLHAPSIHLRYYLEDWTDCLFSWIKFFLLGDLWWHRWEEMQGYADYRGVFEELAADRGRDNAEEASFDAVLATFRQHAEHWIGEVEGWAKGEKGHG